MSPFVRIGKSVDHETPRGSSGCEGTVVTVEKDEVMAQVDMACGPFRIVSLMSREAAEEVDLKPGNQAAAVVKSAMVIVDTR
jgi:molybdopterin-binding protein